jgi:phosphoribosylanthranilate isomerase|tara:strand:+ start:3943 stop:4575 length:633 start_codon:yes stop_codon:yes gene_type:complete
LIQTKVCGITNISDALFSIKCGASALGFVFYKKSERYISYNDAFDVIKYLPPGTAKIGVYVNEDAKMVNDSSKKLNLDYVQLHGDESATFCKDINFPIIKAFRIKDDSFKSQVLKYNVSVFLFDTFTKKDYGGTGKIFNWELIKQGFQRPFIHSGGLNINNVLDAINVTNPDAIDISSGLEDYPGKKDHEKIFEFFKLIRNTSKKGDLWN